MSTRSVVFMLPIHSLCRTTQLHSGSGALRFEKWGTTSCSSFVLIRILTTSFKSGCTTRCLWLLAKHYENESLSSYNDVRICNCMADFSPKETSYTHFALWHYCYMRESFRASGRVGLVWNPRSPDSYNQVQQVSQGCQERHCFDRAGMI